MLLKVIDEELENLKRSHFDQTRLTFIKYTFILQFIASYFNKLRLKTY
ncbi:hypothetical protein [Nostoc piscinale]